MYAMDFKLSDEKPYLLEFKHSNSAMRLYETSLLRMVVDARGCKGVTLNDLLPGRKPVKLAKKKPTTPEYAYWTVASCVLRRHIPSLPDNAKMIYLSDEAKKRLLHFSLTNRENSDRIGAFMDTHWPEPAREYPECWPINWDVPTNVHNTEQVDPEEQSLGRSCTRALTSLSRFVWHLVTDMAHRVMHGR